MVSHHTNMNFKMTSWVRCQVKWHVRDFRPNTNFMTGCMCCLSRVNPTVPTVKPNAGVRRDLHGLIEAAAAASAAAADPSHHRTDNEQVDSIVDVSCQTWFWAVDTSNRSRRLLPLRRRTGGQTNSQTNRPHYWQWLLSAWVGGMNRSCLYRQIKLHCSRRTNQQLLDCMLIYGWYAGLP